MEHLAFALSGKIKLLPGLIQALLLALNSQGNTSSNSNEHLQALVEWRQLPLFLI